MHRSATIVLFHTMSYRRMTGELTIDQHYVITHDYTEKRWTLKHYIITFVKSTGNIFPVFLAIFFLSVIWPFLRVG